MAHGPEVRFIEAMSPEQTEIAARECQRVVRVIASTREASTVLKGRWCGPTAAVNSSTGGYTRRIRCPS
jgi:hypothetical protein